MKEFLDENFLLQSDTAQTLYHEYAKDMPIIDYHCHLPQQQIAEDIKFKNLTQAWLYGDHYKWRAMRSNGINEEYVTGDKSDYEKFEKWAETVPYTMRNPLYHWTHLELRRYFDVYDILKPSSASKIFEQCNAKLQTDELSVRRILTGMNVERVCTTDDPLDNLLFHQQLAKENFSVEVLPTFRPDKSMDISDLNVLNSYIDELEKVSDVSITEYADYISALRSRHDYFSQNGCLASDHGLEQIYAEDYTDTEIRSIFNKIRIKTKLTSLEESKFKSAMLFEFALWDHEKGWAQQYHLGALRNNNSRALRRLGPDTGWDSMGDFPQAQSLSKFLDKLDSNNQLAKTILYNHNPSDNELFATMIGNFNDGSVAGKVQFGSGWWFLDQKDGMARQMNALSNMGLLSRMVGMITDSRSFLSFPRHEYFRRILCNLFANDIEEGELPNDKEWIGKIIQDICYHNAKSYFNK